MTKEEQRIAIAEKCNWQKRVDKYDFMGEQGEFEVWYLLDSRGNCIAKGLPNYTEDLNAMHEAESHLTPYEAYRYNHILGAIEAFAVHATAQRKSEAFCRTCWPERFKI